MKQINRKYWILMADIVDSSSQNSQELQDNFQEIVRFVNLKNKKNILSPLTITLGDEFQGIVKNLKQCIQTIILIEEKIIIENYNFRLRYIINHGNIDTEINSEIAYGMLGEGLSEARELLTNLKKTNTRLLLKSGNKNLDAAINDCFSIYHSILDKWISSEDKSLAMSFVELMDYKLVAKKISKTRSQIWKREKSLDIANYLAIKRLLNYLT